MIKFNDIRKFTSVGHYCVDVPLASINRTIDSYIEESKLEMNPDFQRGHVWTEAQQIAFVEFLIRGGQTNEILFNQPGWMGDWKGRMVLVDGLQRLTALIKFFNNELAVFGGNYYKDFDDNTFARKLTLKFRVNDLKTEKEVLQWYIDLNKGGTPHTDEEINRVEQMIEKLK